MSSYRLDNPESDAAIVAAVAALDRQLAARVKARLALLRLRAALATGYAAQGKIAARPAGRLALAMGRVFRGWRHE